jgi:hypothetical protein
MKRQYLRVAQEITQATIGLYQLFHVLLKFLKKSFPINYMSTLDQGVSCFSEAVACNQAVLRKLETPGRDVLID